MKHKPAIQLSDNHRRGISSALFLLDRMLCGFEDYARGREVRSVFYIEQNILSRDQKKRLLAEIAQMRDLLRDLKDGLGLDVKTEDVGRHIWGHCSTFWEVLVEIQSRFLKRFGEPPPQLAEYLDPRIDVLIEHVRSVADLVRGCDRYAEDIGVHKDAEQTPRPDGEGDGQESD